MNEDQLISQQNNQAQPVTGEPGSTIPPTINTLPPIGNVPQQGPAGLEVAKALGAYGLIIIALVLFVAGIWRKNRLMIGVGGFVVTIYVVVITSVLWSLGAFEKKSKPVAQ